MTIFWSRADTTLSHFKSVLLKCTNFDFMILKHSYFLIEWLFDKTYQVHDWPKLVARYSVDQTWVLSHVLTVIVVCLHCVMNDRWFETRRLKSVMHTNLTFKDQHAAGWLDHSTKTARATCTSCPDPVCLFWCRTHVDNVMEIFSSSRDTCFAHTSSSSSTFVCPRHIISSDRVLKKYRNLYLDWKRKSPIHARWMSWFLLSRFSCF